MSLDNLLFAFGLFVVLAAGADACYEIHKDYARQVKEREERGDSNTIDIRSQWRDSMSRWKKPK